MTRSTQLAYPVSLDREGPGTVLVSFPDVPEALTEGLTQREALIEAEDCLVAALGSYIKQRREIPLPSPPDGRPIIALPALIASKVALYRAMRARDLGSSALAERLGTVEGTIRPLLDLDHRSHIGQVEKALRVLGERLIVETLAA